MLILGGDPDALERVIAGDKLRLEGEQREAPEGSEKDETGVIEAVVSASSMLVGRTAGQLLLQQRFGVNLIAVSRAGERLTKQGWRRHGAERRRRDRAAGAARPVAGTAA